MKKVLITAGATMSMIDQVRGVTNIFRGQTGTKITKYLHYRGYNVTLLTSNARLAGQRKKARWRVRKYRTFNELLHLMQEEICSGTYDAVIHSAAVSDYEVADVWVKDIDGRLVMIDNSKKISSEHEELFFRSVKTEKIVDLIRAPWDFKGYLVKFKLQVGITDDELLKIAEASRTHSDADMIVANCLEWSRKSAFVMTGENVVRYSRKNLPAAITDRMEGLKS